MSSEKKQKAMKVNDPAEKKYSVYSPSNWEVRATAEEFARWWDAPDSTNERVEEIREFLEACQANGSARPITTRSGLAWMFKETPEKAAEKKRKKAGKKDA